MTAPLTDAEWKEALNLCHLHVNMRHLPYDAKAEMLESSSLVVMKAVEEFDPCKGSFRKFLIWKMKQFCDSWYRTKWTSEKLRGGTGFLAEDPLFTVVSGGEWWEAIPDTAATNTLFKKRVLREAVLGLDTKHRVPLMKFYFGKQTYRRIGKEIGCNEARVNILLMEGRRILKKRLAAFNSAMPLPELQIHGSQLC